MREATTPLLSIQLMKHNAIHAAILAGANGGASSNAMDGARR